MTTGEHTDHLQEGPLFAKGAMLADLFFFFFLKKLEIKAFITFSYF